MNRIKTNEIYDNPYLTMKISTLLCQKDFIDEWSEVTAEEVRQFRGAGPKTLRELRKFLAMYGICLKGDIIFDKDSDRNLLIDVPNHIKEMENLLRDVDRRLRWLTGKLEELHCNMIPNNKYHYIDK